MRKVVINACFGGFNLSQEAVEALGLEWTGYGYVDIARDDPTLVQIVESLSERADGAHAELKVVEVPDDSRMADRGIRRFRAHRRKTPHLGVTNA